SGRGAKCAHVSINLDGTPPECCTESRRCAKPHATRHRLAAYRAIRHSREGGNPVSLMLCGQRKSLASRLRGNDEPCEWRAARAPAGADEVVQQPGSVGHAPGPVPESVNWTTADPVSHGS